MQNNAELFCENIKKLRKKKGLSQKQMAKIMGISTITLSWLERGHVPQDMDVEVILNLSEFYHCESKDLFLP